MAYSHKIKAMIKYMKVADATESLENLEFGKVLLTTSDDGGEKPWVKVMTDGRQVLQNHALCFNPFPSWGMILPGGYEHNVDHIRESREIPLHPEAYQFYLDEKLIDDEGNFIVPKPEPNA